MRLNDRRSPRLFFAFLLAAIPLAVCECPGAAAVAAPHTEASPADSERQVRETHARRLALMLAGDAAALAPLLADDLTYGHLNGNVETKAQFLDAIASRRMRYREIDDPAPAVRTYGDAAVVTGIARLLVIAGDQELNPTLRYLAVYARQDGGWRLAAWQSTRFTPPPAG